MTSIRVASVYFIVILSLLTTGFDHPKALYEEPKRSPLEQGKIFEERHEYAKAEEQYRQIDNVIIREMTLHQLSAAWDSVNTNIIRSQASVNQQPESAKARLQLAQDYYSKGLLCTQYLKGSMGQYPRDFVAGEQEFYYQEALRQAKTALQLQPDLPEAHLLIGEVYLANSAKKEALKELKRLIRRNPDFARGYYAIGKVYFDMKDMQMTERYFIRAIRLDPTLYDAYYLLGKFYFERKWFDYAAFTFLEILRKNPKDWPALDMLVDSCHELGKYYIQQERYDQAIQLFQEVLRVKSSYKVHQSFLLARQKQKEAELKAQEEAAKQAEPTPTPGESGTQTNPGGM
jgi:tetratricopeptide (TPR) repeat protein